MSSGSRHRTPGFAPLSITGPGAALAASTNCGPAATSAAKSVRVSTFCGILDSLLRAFTTGLLLEMQAVCHVVNRVLLLMAMRVLTIGVLIFAPIAAGQTTEISQTAGPLSAREKLEFRMRRMVSPMAQLGVLTGSAINQWRDEPAEWGQGWDGYGTRVASGEGVAVSYNAIVAVSAIALHLDPRYRRMPHATVKTRIWNAISQEFLAYRDSGGRTINVSTLAGSYGAGFIANTWEPADHS